MDVLFIVFLILYFLLFIRNILVYKIRTKRIDYIRKFPTLNMNDIRTRQNMILQLQNHSYYFMIIEFHKWTYNQFFKD
jgi:hypothetical protein